jgi:preprotein translocase subunit YajC
MTMMTTTVNIQTKMARLYKGDRVLLLSGKEGEILDLIDETLRTYRIRLIENNEIVYFDDTKLKLKRKHFLNVLLKR